MKNNVTFAITYRILACLVCAFCIAWGLEIFDAGGYNASSWLYYTLQSNVVVCVWFAFMAFATYKTKNPSVYPRANSAVLFWILITFVIFWTCLAPFVSNYKTLLGFSSLGVHAITPAFMIFDYCAFSVGKKMTKRDPLYFAIFPAIYFVFAIIAGLCGALYMTPHHESATHYPYFFMDFNLVGWWIFLTVPLMFAGIIGAGFVFYLLDKRRK